ncbi:MAG: Rieske (2Fe-2S) protein [Planctomycetes bacterium]|nr:Rieske (2Fe-2S) protein [Planctomycetota bacterium]
MTDFTRVANKNEFLGSPLKKVVIRGLEICIFKQDDNFHATSNICPHQGGPLDEGELQDTCIVCPWHGWMFDVRDGSCRLNPNIKIQTFETKIEGNDIYLKI